MDQTANANLQLLVTLSGGRMTCKEAIRLICEYLEVRLSPLLRNSVQLHLEQCHDCRLVLNAAEKTLEVDFDRERHFEDDREARSPGHLSA
jgi:hypothetical protein